MLITLLVWLKLLSPYFELVTDAGEKSGRETLRSLEEVRQVFRPVEAGLPVRVYLFSSERGLRPFRPAETTSGFFQSTPERNVIALHVDGAATSRVAVHEYVHLVLNHSSARLPRWFEEGTAEFYSTLESNAGKLVIGRPILSHIATLRAARWLSAEELFAARAGAPLFDERSRVGLFYAQSWALVHMLNLSGEYHSGMQRFAEGATFFEAFGRTRETAIDDLRRYIGGRSLPTAELPGPPGGAAPEARAETLDAISSAVLLAELYLDTGKNQQAERAYQNLLKRGAPETSGETALGMLALRRRNFTEARRHLERAIALGSRQASTYFEYAMLLRDTGGQPREVRGLLERAVELNPSHAEAHFILGLTDEYEGRLAAAIGHFERATGILPRQSYFWHALAMARHKAGDVAGAHRAASRALDNAVTEQEEGMAQAALRLAAPAEPPAPAPKPSATVPPGWNAPKGDARVEGVLRRIDCFGTSARLFVEAAGRHVSVLVGNPGEVLLRSASSLTFEFTCGVQKPRQVAIEYTSRPDTRLGTAGDVTAIEFR